MSQFVDEYGVDHEELRRRELALPPELRMTGKRRDLRDAFLAKFMLSEAMAPWTMPVYDNAVDMLSAIGQRENARGQAQQVINELSRKLPAEDVEKCKEVAKLLHGYEIDKQRRAANRKRK